MDQQRVLIITHDVVDENMAGPAIRCWEFARVIGREAKVTLATPHASSLSPSEFDLVRYDGERLEALACESDVVILSGAILWHFPFLRSVDASLVMDIYDPFLLESLPMLSREPGIARRRRHADTLDALTDLLIWGDYFVCSSERQRDYWLGWLNALGRINPDTYDDDPTLRRLIDVVPFGVPDTPPEHTHPVLKGVRPGLSAIDHVVLWGGGVYNWFDPLTLIRAMERVSSQRDDVKLVFLGIHHPNPEVGGHEMAEQTIALSRELGLYETCVFFNDWTPYNERQNYLLEADVGISLHFAHLETHFSFRTRLLDYIWAGLPIIVTQGDVLSSLVEERELGWTVDYESVDDVTEAILVSTESPRGEFDRRFAAVAADLQWKAVIEPLLAFCLEPRQAADRGRFQRDIQSLPSLKLISQINALRRDLNNRDQRLSRLQEALGERKASITDLRGQLETEKRRLAAEHEALRAREEEVGRLRETITEIRQGRVMRFLDGINHIVKGGSLW